MTARRAVLAALVLATVIPLAPALAAQAAQAAQVGPGAPEVQVPEQVDLDRPVHGARAVRELGDHLDAAARRNQMTADELRSLLLGDETAWVDPTGRVYFKEPAPETAGEESAEVSTAPTPAAADALTLHSKPGSQHVIFLDFDGSLVSGTAWNDFEGVADGLHPAWTLDADATTFDVAERELIASVWARVAEDYAPFDVDVTTQDPGAAAIDRTSISDLTYGTRVLISPSTNAINAICGGSCGGVAYLDVFDVAGSSHAYYQPAWVFPQALSNSAKNIAEAASHEAGHNFGLSHDGTSTVGYYTGHAMWAPIMGVGYNRPVVQWSRGQYSDANNTQDDVAIIAANGAPLRVDEAGGTVGAAAASLPAGTAYVTAPGDRDVYALGTCVDALSLTAQAAPTSPNLDIQLTLLAADGSTVASADPVSAMSSTDVATGMSASLALTVPSGSYFLRVDGVGNGTPSTGYDDYGSLGAYTLGSSGCSGTAPATAPGAPVSVAVSPAADGRSAILTWSPPVSDGGSPVTGYVVSRTGGSTQTLGAEARSATFTGLTPGASYTFSVAAVNVVGTGAAATTSSVMPFPVTTPSAPQGLRVTVRPDALAADLAWSPPADDGGAPVLAYLLTVGGADLGEVGAATTGVTLTGLQPGTTYDVAVRARNTAGLGSAASTSFTVPVQPVTTAPTAPGIGKAAKGSPGGRRTASVSWSPPTSTGGAAVDGYQVLAYRLDRQGTVVAKLQSGVLNASARRAKLRLPAGRYAFVVRVHNPIGWSPLSARSNVVKAR